MKAARGGSDLHGLTKILFLGLALTPAALSGCASTSTSTTASFDFAPPAGFSLPDTMALLPYGRDESPAESVPQQVANAFVDTGNVIVETTVAATSSVVDAITPSAFSKVDSPRGKVDELIVKYAAVYDVPVDLVRSVVKRESNFNPSAFNHGHWGLMQIKHATARGMGYTGDARGLLDAETNLKYSVKYLRGAYMVANGDHRRADRFYQTGYYYDAKRAGLLDETGLGTDRVRRRAHTSI